MPILAGSKAALRLLAFDTSTERLAIAVHDGHRSWLLDLQGGAAASAGLLPALHDCLAQAGLVLADVDAIAFGRGPGAFTGLRTACAVAQGLGFGLARPLLPIDSLAIVAEDARQQAGLGQRADFEVAVAMDARMNEVYAARYCYRYPGGVGDVGVADGACAAGRRIGWQVLQAPALVPLAGLADFWGTPPSALAGSALAAFGAAAVLPPGAQAFSQVQNRAGALLRLAQGAAQAGDFVDAADGLPLYLRDKVAQTTDERAALKAAAAALHRGEPEAALRTAAS